mmetsp:Transcript_54905/g.146613  ORF Transcript_54905/g.146613 Transcript_54905/m.146613 type:complete len:88 (+) Transcript_54905:275-538(+)
MKGKISFPFNSDGTSDRLCPACPPCVACLTFLTTASPPPDFDESVPAAYPNLASLEGTGEKLVLARVRSDVSADIVLVKGIDTEAHS